MRTRLILMFALLSSAGTAAAQPGVTPPVDNPAPAYSEPAPPPGPPPPPSSRVTFVSTGATRWDVRIDDNAVCTTPCSIPIEPMRFVTMHSHDRHPIKLDVGYVPDGDVLVRAKPRDNGAFATGITFTTLGGAAAVTGITLFAVGSATDNGTMYRAGLITGVIGLGVTAGSIQLIRRSLPRAHVGRAQPYVAGTQVGLAGAF
ncbi:MAG TPA: hypothetical protein VFQ53_15830 [Kofleriaceae bacterium]|nr:hypothetical protein [Kofleriaceae bacterium]